MMKQAFSFIKHAINKKEIDDRLSAIHCVGDKVQSYNGWITMEHPLKGMGTFSVAQAGLFRAVEACSWEPDIKVTEKNVILKNGRVRLQLPITSDFIAQKPQRKNIQNCPEDLLDQLARVRPFISEDASRGWSTSVHIKNGYIHATNNMTIVRSPSTIAECTIPVEVVDVLLKLKVPPVKYSMGMRTVYFEWGNRSWMQGNLIIEKWPDFKELFDKRAKVKRIPPNLLEAVQKLKYFCPDDILYIRDKVAFTDTCKISGIKLPDTTISCRNIEMALQCFDKGNFKKPLIHLTGDGIEGVMASISA